MGGLSSDMGGFNSDMGGFNSGMGSSTTNMGGFTTATQQPQPPPQPQQTPPPMTTYQPINYGPKVYGPGALNRFAFPPQPSIYVQGPRLR
ncbi:hypothetical protein Pmani_031330 [Petrolisthes manimaculis]|uniref:Uncharacterized protein n=1 Tax=Petrolisthes manimaculis TaxID=1843537 RepID=A0AAE1NTZ3_9EUCA|nr:hypothetical protein Pmani_031330 [Petrolisthes manimaculis]